MMQKYNNFFISHTYEMGVTNILNEVREQKILILFTLILLYFKDIIQENLLQYNVLTTFRLQVNGSNCACDHEFLST